MSSVKSIVELATVKFYDDVQKVLDESLSQICTDLNTYLATDPIVKSFFASLQSSLGVFADPCQRNVVEQVAKSATIRCREHLTGNAIRKKCIQACLKDCDVESATEDESHSIDDLWSINDKLKKDLNAKDQSLEALKEDLAREKIYRKQESQIRDEERNKQRKRKSKNKASDLPANKFCKNVMRDFQKEEIWSYVARPHANQKSPYKAKFDEAIVARIYDGKLRLKDDLQRPVENRSDFKQSFIDLLQECHRDFDHPVVHIGKDSVSLLDVAEQFKRFWAKNEVELQANTKSSETESDAAPSAKRKSTGDHQSDAGGKMLDQDRDHSKGKLKQCSSSLDERANNSTSVQLMDLLRSDGESGDDVDQDEIAKMIELLSANSRKTKDS